MTIKPVDKHDGYTPGHFANYCINGFMKQMHKIMAKQVWLYFISRTMRLGYATTTNLPVVLNTPQNTYLNQATKKNTCKIFLLKKISESKISETQKNLSIIPVT